MTTFPKLDGTFKIASSLIDCPLNDNGEYALSGYDLVLELTKSLDIEQLQDIYSKVDDLKLELEKQILRRS